MDHTEQLQPGQEWIGVITRPTVDEFALAFTVDPVLEASALPVPLTGVGAIRSFFEATRARYDAIAFTRQSCSGPQTYLEWEGTFQGDRVVGITVLTRDTRGAIAQIRIFHLPFDQLLAFAENLSTRLVSTGVKQ